MVRNLRSVAVCAVLAAAGCGGMEEGDGGAPGATETATAGAKFTGSTGRVDYSWWVPETGNFPATYQVWVHWNTSVATTSRLVIQPENAARNDAPIVRTESIPTTVHSFYVELLPVARYRYQVISTLSDGTTDATTWYPFTTPAGNFDVGVIPDAPTRGTWPNLLNSSCPNQHPVIFEPGNEWTRNRNTWGGWLGATYLSSGNWMLNVCRVDGRKFRPIVYTRNMIYDYAVLQLGTTCPNGSMSFNKYFDGEDENNSALTFTDDGGGGASVGPNWTQGWGGGNMQLYWCLFTNGSSVMPQFPQLVPGYGYGVFAPTDFPSPWAVSWGWIYMDDEDSGNADRLSPDIEAVQRIVTSGSNSKINFARVR